MITQGPIDPATHIGAVSLTVSDLARSLAFYTSVLGMRAHRPSGGVASLAAADDSPLLRLVEVENARPKPPRATGLYHFALLLPDRIALARWLRHVAGARWPLQGWSDHGVSEAIYLADPDGNGIEVYRDRPKNEWPLHDGQLQMVTEPLDAAGLLALAQQEPAGWTAMPAGTTMGHIHLHVADVDRAQAFYCDVLGFGLVQRYGPSALFVSAGGYHHHIGLNTWAGVGAPPAPAGSAGLREYAVVLPDAAALAAVVERLATAGIDFQRDGDDVLVADPSHNILRLTHDSGQ